MTRRRWTRWLAASAGCALLAVTAQAQWVVYDPSNYAEAVVQYEQLVQQYQFLLAQARRVPVDIASRYRGYAIDWTRHDGVGVLYAAPLMTALNQGDAVGAAYRAVSDPLDVPGDIAGRMSPELQRRLRDTYATLEWADSANRLAIDQTGIGRAQGPLVRQSIDHVEVDSANGGDDFHSQTALLEKITAASAIQLREGQQTNQFLLSTLEQQLVDAKRKRDADARLMNATIYQWRYGQMYGADLFRNTTSNLDTWQPY
jgi:hypothetical protein